MKNHRERLEKKITENPKKQNPEHREQFVRLLVRNDRAIRAWLRSLLPTLDDVDEVMQEVSVVAWRKFDQLDDPENFRRWACVIARYEVLMYRRKKARDRIVLGQEVEKLIADEGLEELDRRERQLAALEACVAKLPEKRKSLVLRVYANRQSIKTLAVQLGKTPDALYKALSRTRLDLHECVKRSLAQENQT